MTADRPYDLERSIALSASAGSGKTFVLTARLVALLLSGVKISDILVVTFTNLAASDIRRKLLERVDALARGDKNQLSLFSALLKQPDGLIRRKAIALRQTLVARFSLLQISTLDSFFARLVKRFPRETGVIQDIVIVDELRRQDLLGQSFERFYRSLRTEGPLMDRVYSFVAHFRESTLRPGRVVEEVYRAIESKRYALRKVQAAVGDSRNAYDRFMEMRKLFLDKRMRDDVRFLVQRLTAHADAHGGGRYIDAFARDLSVFLKEGSVEHLAALTPFKRDDVSYVRKVCDSLEAEQAHRFDRVLRRIRNGLESYLHAQMLYYLSMWLEIHDRIDGIFKKIKGAGQFMDFADIEETALGLLAHLPDRDYLSYRMGSEMRHILIDEFQDTSELQWEALRPLVNRSIALGGTVFYVGDEKQSIYRWRGGQPSLFEEVRGELRLEKQRLAYSYRQSGTVLDFVNSVFTRIGSALGPSFSYEPQELPADRSGERFGYVSVTEAEQKDTLVDQICDRIDGLRLDGIDLDDIAVLCRKNREIEELEKQLKRRRIPCRAAGKSRLFQDYAIQDMLSVIRFALDPGEQVHLAGLLRSPLFRWSYEEIERARDDAGVLTLEGIGRIDAGIAERLSSLANRGRYLSPSAFLRTLYEELNALDCYRDRRVQLLKLYELAYQFENSSDRLLLSDFVGFLRENSGSLTMELSDERGVQLLTIHASKGLEFHTVVLPFVDQPVHFRLDGSILFGKTGKSAENLCMIAHSLYRDYLGRAGEMEELLRIADLEYRTDELNTLYVALTRARENLLIFPLRRAGMGETVGDLLVRSIDPEAAGRTSPFAWARGTLRASKEEKAVDFRRIRPLGTFSGDRAGVRAADTAGGADAGVRARRPAVLKGLVVHRALEYIRSIPAGDEDIVNSLACALAAEGKPYTRAERMNALPEARSSLVQVLSDPRLADYFAEGAVAEGLFLSREYPNLMGRIDRVLVKEDVLVLDFKTDRVRGREPLAGLAGRYGEQVAGYCRSLRRYYPRKKIRGFLYFTEAEYENRLVRVY